MDGKGGDVQLRLLSGTVISRYSGALNSSCPGVDRGHTDKFETFDISFAGGKNVFAPGDFVTATVRIKPREDLKCNAIRIKWKGVQHCQWAQGDGDTKRHFSDRSELIDTQVTIWGKPKDGENKSLVEPDNEQTARRRSLSAATDVLTAVLHSFTVTIQLPDNLPPSILPFYRERVFAGCVYSLRAFVDVSWSPNPMAGDPFVEQPFSVVPVIALDDERWSTREPYSLDHKEILTNCFCMKAERPLTVKARLDKATYSLGEKVTMTITCNNASGTAMGTVLAKLRQYIKVSARNGADTYYVDEPISDGAFAFQNIPSDGADKTATVSFNLPDSGLPLAPHCNGGPLQLTYQLHFHITIPGCHSDLDSALDFILCNAEKAPPRPPRAEAQPTEPLADAGEISGLGLAGVEVTVPIVHSDKSEEKKESKADEPKAVEVAPVAPTAAVAEVPLAPPIAEVTLSAPAVVDENTPLKDVEAYSV